jgi:L-histidine Nalpha-methyltransferase
MPITLTFDDSQYPARLAEQLRQGLRQRRLPIKFLYDSPAQAQRWLAYHQAYSPSRTETALLILYQQAFQAALDFLQPTALHYISLGCGGGQKDKLLLQQAVSQCQTLHFTPIDVSAALVLETMEHIQDAFPGLSSSPYVLDLNVQPELTALFTPHEIAASRRLLSCFGMLPNFAYRAFLPYVQSLMRPGDVLLISANLSPVPYSESWAHILPQYDNPLAHAWFAGLLDSLGFSTSHLRITVQAQPLRADGHIWHIQAYATFVEPACVTLQGETFHFTPDERLHLFFSHRFTPQVMPSVLADAGLSVLKTFLFASQEEGIYVCTRSA